MSERPEWAEGGFPPTVTGVYEEYGDRVLETATADERDDLVSTAEGLVEKREFLTEEQERAVELQEG